MKECIGNNGAGPKQANVEDLKLPLFGAVAKGAGSSEKRQPLLQNVAENIVYLVQAEAHGIRCFHCKAKETTKWHVFGGEVSCVCILSLVLLFLFPSLSLSLSLSLCLSLLFQSQSGLI